MEGNEDWMVRKAAQNLVKKYVKGPTIISPK